jgi:hypothetical protein
MRSSPGLIGTHVIGLPAIFLRSDILSDLDPQVWDYPDRGRDPVPEDEVYRALGSGIMEHVWDFSSMRPPPISEFDALRSRATINHEIRHFHDSVVTPGLFEKFLLEAQRAHISMLLLRNLAGAGAESVDEGHLTAEDRELLRFHRSRVTDRNARFASREQPRKLDGTRILVTVFDLLEANAIATELFTVAALVGKNDALTYWIELQRLLPARYTQVLDHILGSDPRSIEPLLVFQQFAILSLLSDGHPIDTLNSLLSHRQSQSQLTNNLHIARLTERARETCSTPDTGPIFQLTATPHATVVHATELVAIREEVLRLHAASDYTSSAYHESLSDYPIPATCFFADDLMHQARVLPFVRKAALRVAYGDVFSLCSRRDLTRRTTLSAGLIPTPGYMSHFALPRVESLLSFRFIGQALFGHRVSYAPDIDQMYQLTASAVLGLRMEYASAKH